MSEFKKGDRVRVTHEGEISWIGAGGQSFEVTAAGQPGRYVYAVPKELTLLERKKPALKAGDVVRYDRGTYLIGVATTAYTHDDGDVVFGPTVEALATRIARNPKLYKINGEAFA